MRTFDLEVREDEKSRELAAYIKQRLEENGMIKNDQPELVIVVGGDGTFLKGVHKHIDDLDKTAIIGIHTGTLGFLNDYKANEVDKLIHDILNKEPEITSYRLLQANCSKGTFYSVNEMRIENMFKTQILDIYADNDFVETARGTGVCLSGQMGSTAYNRSLNGAIIQSGLELLQLCEVTCIHNSIYKSLQSPIIFRPDTTIKLTSDTFVDCCLMYDHKYIDISDIKEIEIKLSNKHLNVARFKPYDYNERLRSLY